MKEDCRKHAFSGVIIELNNKDTQLADTEMNRYNQIVAP
jgi:hypothetical protein